MAMLGMSTMSPRNVKKLREFVLLLAENRRKNLHCDVTINLTNAEDESGQAISISAHKLILASSSSTLYKILELIEPHQNLKIPGMTQPTFEFLLDYMYSRTIGKIEEETMYDLYKGAKYLGLAEVQSAASNFILTCRRYENCLDIWIFGQEQDCAILADPQFIFQNFSLISNTPAFQNLSSDQLKWLISQLESSAQSPANEILLCLHKWVSPPGKGTLKEFVTLVKGLPDDQLDYETMGKIFEDDPFIANDEDCDIFFNRYCRKFFAKNRQNKFNPVKIEPDNNVITPTPTPPTKSVVSKAKPKKEKGRRPPSGDYKFNTSDGNDASLNDSSNEKQKRRHSSTSDLESDSDLAQVPVVKKKPKSMDVELTTYFDADLNGDMEDDKFFSVTDENLECVAYFLNGTTDSKHRRQIRAYNLVTMEHKITFKLDKNHYNRHRGELVYTGDKLYFLGGVPAKEFENGDENLDSEEGGAIDILHLNHPPTWETKNLPRMRRSRCDFHACVIENTIYAVGGCSGPEVMNSVEVLPVDDLEGGWSNIADMRCWKDSAAVAVFEDRIFTLGGLLSPNTSKDPVASKIVECYDTKGQPAKWQDIPAMRVARLGAAAVVLASKLYVMGGGSTFDKPFKKYNNVEIFDLQTWTWDMAKPMLKKRQFFSAVAFNGKIYCLGGDAQQKPTMERFDPKTQKWRLMDSSLPIHGDYRAVAFKIGNDGYESPMLD